MDSLRAFRGYTTPLTDRLASAANFFEIPQLEMQLNLLAFLLSPVECLLCIGSVAVRARDIMNVHRPRRAARRMHHNHDSLSYLPLVDVTSSVGYASNANELSNSKVYKEVY